MKVIISSPPLVGDGVPLLGQNRQFQWFHNPSFIYPMVPASAATLLQKEGFEVIWNDAIAERWNSSQFFDFLAREKPDLVAIETKTPVVSQHWQIIGDMKKENPTTKVVLMGDHVTAMPEESMERSKVDYVITGGDYDFSLLSIARHLQDGTELGKGIWYRKNGMVANTGGCELAGDLNQLPLIDRELTKWQLYSEHIFKRKPATYTMVGRDCWYAKCAFCSWTTIFPKFRVRRPESLLDEIGMLIERYKIREIFDDTGTFPVGGWLNKFAGGMIERGYNKKIKLSINMRVGVLSQEQYNLMGQAGFRVLKFGLESANQATLDRLNKGTTVEEISNSCRMAKRAGLEVHLTTMVGYPWESKEDAQRTLDLAKCLMTDGYADMLQATVTIPYPGTPLFRMCKESNWLATEDWSKYDMTRPIMTSPIPAQEIMALTQGLYRSFLTPRFLLRKAFSIRDVDDVRFFYRAGKAVLGHLLDFGRGTKGESRAGC